MDEKKESPDRGEPIRGDNSLEGSIKDRLILSERQKKVYDLLCTGKHSVTDITINTGYADPRSYIRYLREKGITVKDENVHKDDVIFKRYWIEREPDPASHPNSLKVNKEDEVINEPHFKDLFDTRFNY